MPKVHEKLGNADQTEMEFGAFGSYDCDTALRLLIATVLKSHRKSRAQIADEMTALLGVRVTDQMLNCYTAESKEKHRFPAAFLPALCKATADTRLIAALADKIGMRLITAEEVQLLELGRNYLKQKQAAEEVSRLESSLTRRKP
jgi:hypothetical protein